MSVEKQNEWRRRAMCSSRKEDKKIGRAKVGTRGKKKREGRTHRCRGEEKKESAGFCALFVVFFFFLLTVTRKRKKR